MTARSGKSGIRGSKRSEAMSEEPFARGNGRVVTKGAVTALSETSEGVIAVYGNWVTIAKKDGVLVILPEWRVVGVEIDP